jgi:hypothetical protein
MIRREIGRRQHDFGRSFDNGERTAPTQQRIACVASRLSALVDKHVEKLTRNLYRDDGGGLGQSANKVQSCVMPFGSVDALRRRARSYRTQSSPIVLIEFIACPSPGVDNGLPFKAGQQH